MLELDVKCSDCGGSGAISGEGWPEWNERFREALGHPQAVAALEAEEPTGPEEVLCGVCDGRQRVPTSDGEAVLAFLARQGFARAEYLGYHAPHGAGLCPVCGHYGDDCTGTITA